VNSDSVFSRTVASWKLSLVYSGKMLHYLTRAVLLSLASAGMGFAWCCCWLDQFRSTSSTAAWLIPGRAAVLADPERHSTVMLAERYQSRGSGRPTVAPRTIDSLIRNKGVRA